MQIMSSKYDETMKWPVRPQALMNVSIGVINQDAQVYAEVDNINDALYISSFDIFSDNKRPYYYATFEQNISNVDGSMFFIPRDAILNSNNGFISKKVISSGNQFLHIKFNEVGRRFDIKGLTIQFGITFPTVFDVVTDNETFRVEGNDKRLFVTNHVFTSVTFFKIVPVTMVNQNQRLRIERVLFGLGVNFTNKQIKSASLKTYVSPISNDIPQVDFTLTVDNSDSEYNIENKTSTLNFFETGQNVEVSIGQELLDGGVEWIKCATLTMKAWEADDIDAKFTMSDFLDEATDDYYKGKYYPNGISLYDLAIDVFNDMELEPDKYIIDEYLKTVIVKNPLPVAKHKEAIQVIANCGRCVFAIDNFGRIALRSSFIPEFTVNSSNQHRISTVDNIIQDVPTRSYAMFDNGSTSVDGTFYFVQKTGNPGNSFFVSNSISNANCTFSDNPKIGVILEARYNSMGINIEFEDALPAEFILRTYNGTTLLDTITVSNIKQVTNLINKLYGFNKLEIEFTKTSIPNARIRVKKFAFGDFTDYRIDYDDLKSTPKGKQLEKVQAISVTKTSFIETTDIVEVTKTDVVASPAENEFILFLNEPGYAFQVSAGLYSAQILESGAYYVKVRVTGLTQEDTVSIVVTGKLYKLGLSSVSKTINDKGIVKGWDNPLVSDDIVANDLLEWLSDYYASDLEYELSYRGDPALESNDVFYLESKYIDNVLCKIYEHDLSFNGAISGKIKARREVNV